VQANEVEFWGIGEDALRQMEEEDLYPPRFIVGVDGSVATEAVSTLIEFTGAREDLQTELSLQPYHHTSPHSLPSKQTNSYLYTYIVYLMID